MKGGKQKTSKSVNYKCRHCRKTFKYESLRKRHELSHSALFECNSCHKVFSFISALRRHEKQHERTSSVECAECHKKFKDEVLLKRHMKYAHEGIYFCKQCSAIFMSELALSTHMKTHQEVSKRRYRCSHQGCEKSFNYSHHLKHHELTHTNTKQHFCNVCKKGFIQSHHLKAHLKTHEPESWFSCTVSRCNKKFSSEYALRRHKATHNFAVNPATETKEDVILLNTHKETSIAIRSELGRKDDILKIDLDIQEKSTNLDEKLNEIKVVSESQSYMENESYDCESALGGCIAADGDNCICAQMSTIPSDMNKAIKVNHKGSKNSTKAELSNEQSDCSSKLSARASVDISDLDAENNNKDKVCSDKEGCCSRKNENKTVLNVNDLSMKCCTPCNETMPAIEYRTDGSIKLKDTFDFTMDDIQELNSEKSPKIQIDLTSKINMSSVPYFSCKEVLGNCIVSGDETIGEGCFCARMNLESLTEQEIEEITPCPENSYKH